MESVFLASDRAKKIRKWMTSRPESPSEFSKVRTYRTESLFLSLRQFLEGIPFGRSSLCSFPMFKNPSVFAHLIDRMCKNPLVFKHRKARRRGPPERNPSFYNLYLYSLGPPLLAFGPRLLAFRFRPFFAKTKGF